jgi:hypothetical protein
MLIMCGSPTSSRVSNTYSNYTNQMHNIYSLHIFTVLPLHVSMYNKPSTGRTHVPPTQNHLLLHSYYLWLTHYLRHELQNVHLTLTEFTIIYTLVTTNCVAILCYVKNLNSLWLKSIHCTCAYIWLWSAVDFVDYIYIYIYIYIQHFKIMIRSIGNKVRRSLFW